MSVGLRSAARPLVLLGRQDLALHRQVKEVVIGPCERQDVPAHVAECLSSDYRCQADHLAPCAATFRQELSSSESRRAVAAGAEVITTSPNGPRKRCACSGDLNRRMARSR